jgi:epoxyqueuosine reductase
LALPLREDAFRPRAAIADKDTHTLTLAILAIADESFRIGFKGSPMKRAKLRGLKRNAVVVLRNLRTREDANVLTRALDDPEALVREHAAWWRQRVTGGGAP